MYLPQVSTDSYWNKYLQTQVRCRVTLETHTINGTKGVGPNVHVISSRSRIGCLMPHFLANLSVVPLERYAYRLDCMGIFMELDYIFSAKISCLTS